MQRFFMLKNPTDLLSELYSSLKQNDRDKIKRLVKEIDINTVTEPGKSTLLHQASFNGDIDVIAILIELGADVNKIDKYGHTPLDVALIYSSKAADLLRKNGGKQTCFDIATYYARFNHSNK